MSGILNNKERIIDTILTREGRRQLSEGGLDIKFASFSDAHAYYAPDVVSGSENANERIYLEASSLPHDLIAFEADDSGKLAPYPNSEVSLYGGNIISGLEFVTGEDFTSLSETLLSSSIDSFQKLHTIGTSDLFAEDNEFSLSTNKINFSITKNKPIKEDRIKKININNLNTFFQDKKLSQIPNFQYLPPVNKRTSRNPNGSKLGKYPKLNQANSFKFEDLKKELSGKEKISVHFSETSLENNLMTQFFEKKNDELLKLDVLDFGEFIVEDDEFPEKHIYFVGKIFVNEFGAKSFIKLFTLEFE